MIFPALGATLTLFQLAVPREFKHPSNYRLEQFTSTSALEAGLGSGTELIGVLQSAV
jgi:hypothetical protein